MIGKQRKMPVGSFGNSATVLLVALIVIMITVRALTMSMTGDEAFTVSFYAAHGERIFSAADFWPNNHVLHTIFVWGMFQFAPWQEWAMRLPALIAGIGTVLMLRQLGIELFLTPKPVGEPAERSESKAYFHCVLLIALVAFHPLVFQFLSFARGYGMSLFFSLLGFYLLLRLLRTSAKEDEKTWPNRRLTVAAGLVFGLSVASNLTAAVMNISLIAAALAVHVIRNGLRTKDFWAFLGLFCLPGAAIVTGLYAPILLFVSPDQFSYAMEVPLEGLLDLVTWTLGHSAVVPVDSMTRLLLGMPVSEDTYWFAVILFPFVVLLPLAALGLFFCVKTLRRKKDSDEPGPGDVALPIVFGALLCYTVILFVAWSFGKNLFPKDRTGVLPVAYAMMLPVLLLHEISRTSVSTGAGRWGGRILSALLLLGLFHQLTLFSFPYYHNIWYGDADMREMMREVKTLTAGEPHPQSLVCLALNESSIEYYMEKYKIEGLRIERILEVAEVEDISMRPDRTLYILPACEAEATIQRNSKWYSIYRRTPYTDLILIAGGRGD